MEQEIISSKNDITVSDIELDLVRGRYNILDCEARTGKTYWAVHNLIKFTRDSMLKRILFLVDTSSLKNSILEKYSDYCCAADEWWTDRENHWGEAPENKIGVMCYQSLGMKVIKGDVSFLSDIDCICWDECDSIFDYAAPAFEKALKTDFNRKDHSNREILYAIQEYSSKKEYMPLVLLGKWEQLVHEGRLMLIGMSATPERAKRFYQAITSAANKGRLENHFRNEEDLFFYNVASLITEKLRPLPGQGYYLYSPWVKENQKFVNLAKSVGFNAIEIHSPNNEDYPMDEEQKRVSSCLDTVGMIPLEYNFVVVNKYDERGIDLHDERFKDLICNSINPDVQNQYARAVFPYQRYLLSSTPAIPDEYKNRYLSLDECRELAKNLRVQDGHGKHVKTWNKLIDFLPECGYTIEKDFKALHPGEKRQTVYKITGESKQLDFVDDIFEQLNNAQNEKEEA